MLWYCKFLIAALVQAWRKQVCIGPSYWYKYPSAKLGGSGGMLPQENFLNLMLPVEVEHRINRGTQNLFAIHVIFTSRAISLVQQHIDMTRPQFYH